MSRHSWIDLLGRIVRAIRSTPAPSRAPRPARAAGTPTPTRYPGDFTGRPTVEYRPRLDGDPDPGEVVWTWVPFEEDHSQGKDRPVLLIGTDGPWLLGLMLSSRDHDADARDEARWGRYWMDIGAGSWDRQGRPSEVRLDRILRVDPAGVRREGAVLDSATFTRVADSLKRHHS